MPYVLPSDLTERRLGLGAPAPIFRPRLAPLNRGLRLQGDYLSQRFVVPTNSLAGDFRSRRVALGGGVVSDVITRPPYRTLGSWFDESTAGIPNTYLALGGAVLAAVLLTGGARRRRR